MTKLALLFSFFAILCARAQDAPVVEIPVAPPVQDSGVPDDATRVSVLGYHDFSESLPETAMRIRTSKFRQQMETIRQMGFTVISLEDFIEWKKGEKQLPERCILLTFDDGWKSVYTDAFPILKEFGYPYTLYLYKNYVDGGGKALTIPMIEEMIKAGASIGSHSVSHPYPATVKAQRQKGEREFDAFLRKEIGESKRFLESKFPVPVTTFAYPGGFFTQEMLTLADEFRYTHLFTVQPGKVKRSLPNNTLPRYMILGNYDRIFEFATTFQESGGVGAVTGGITANGSGPTIPTTPFPVKPDPGVIINSRLPEISADLSDVENLDPATLVMKVAGFGEVPAQFDPVTKRFSWQINRRLRQNSCQVLVTWKDSAGQPPAKPLRWSFQIDRESAYLPDGD
jgi:peptidoglycan/xylan/chitin deacetylase (PgdA/CDA1 family)